MTDIDVHNHFDEIEEAKKSDNDNTAVGFSNDNNITGFSNDNNTIGFPDSQKGNLGYSLLDEDLTTVQEEQEEEEAKSSEDDEPQPSVHWLEEKENLLQEIEKLKDMVKPRIKQKKPLSKNSKRQKVKKVDQEQQIATLEQVPRGVYMDDPSFFQKRFTPPPYEYYYPEPRHRVPFAPMSSMNTMIPMNPMINPMNPMNPMNQMNSMNPMNPMNPKNQMNPMSMMYK
ncbi:hypothetical protein ACA910_017229 [Epithemia clementina (nom. ined.)]